MKSSINLLPNEYAVTAKQQKKFSLVRTISILAILVLFLIGSVIVALRVIQTQNITTAKGNIQKLEGQITQFKDKEATLFVLKNRLSNISRVLALPSKQLEMYKYAQENLPGEITITSITSDRSGSLGLSAMVPDTNTLERTIDSLTNQAAFEAIKRIEIDNLARGRDGIYRINLRVVPKE